jgi:hypothetical protein
MQRTPLATWASSLLAVVGAVLVGAMFVDWIDVGGEITATGYRIAADDKPSLFLVPIAGLILLAAAAFRSAYTRLAAVGAGALVVGGVAFWIVRDMAKSGADAWLIFGGAAVVLAGVGAKRRGLRALGGLAVLAGVVAPWATASLLDVLTSDEAGAAFAELGVSIGILWAIPAAAVLAIASAASTATWAPKLAATAGIAIYGAFLYLLGSVANLVLAWGAWATLGAGALALVFGLLAPGQAAGAAAPAPSGKR